MNKPNPRHIIELWSSNFKRLKVVRIHADGKSVVIGGANGEGKTSTLDVIWAALGGGKDLPARPIRDGEDSAVVGLNLGDLVVERHFTKRGSRLELRTKEGAVIKSPQAVLDRMVGSLTFDPLTFMRANPKKQAATLQKLAGLDLDLLDEDLTANFDQRTAANRELLRATNRLKEIGPETDAPAEELSISDLLRKRDAMAASNTKRETAQRFLVECKRVHSEALDSQRAADQEVDASHHSVSRALQSLEAEGKAQDIGPVEAQLASAEALNAAVRHNKQYRKASDDMRECVLASDGLTKKIESLRKERQKAIEGAAYPIEGLLVGSDGVTFEGIPIEQASSAEQIRVSAAIGIALNPELRVLLIRDGSLLDEESLTTLLEQAKTSDAQLWIERVGDGDEVTVVIEDGEVRA